MRDDLTKAQKYIFLYIVRFYLNNKRSPSYRDISVLSDRSVKTVHDCAVILVRKGWLRKISGLHPIDIDIIYRPYNASVGINEL